MSRFLSFNFFALVFVSASLFAGEEVIASIEDKGRVTLKSGRTLQFADHPAVDSALDQMEEGGTLYVEGSGVVVVTHECSRLLFFADERDFEGEATESIDLFSLPRAGSRYLITMLRLNLPKTNVRMHPFPVEQFTEALRGLGNLKNARTRLLTEGVVEQTSGENKLDLIALRAPRAYIASLYRSSALPFKEDVARGFDLFLNGNGRLPRFIQQENPLTGELCSNPLQVRQLLLLKALFIERSAQKSLVIDFEKWRANGASLIARICAEYGFAHAPYFKEAALDTSGQGPYRPRQPLDLTAVQEVQLRAQLDRKLEQHFGFSL